MSMKMVNNNGVPQNISVKSVDGAFDPNYSIYDSMYIRNGRVICNNNHKAGSVVAKYAAVDLKSNVTEIKCRIIAANIFSTTLITTKLLTENNVDCITKGSFHVCFHKTNVVYGIYQNGTWSQTTINYNALEKGKEYVVGFAFLGNDSVRFYMPDRTTTDVVVDGVDEINGSRFIFENYFTNTSDVVSSDIDGYTPFTGILCIGTTTHDILRDNFQRGDGILGIAPTGQAYMTWRNNSDFNIFDNTNN